MSQEAKKKLAILQEQASAARRLNAIASFSGVIAIPFAFIGIIIGNQTLSAAALCWLVSHFIGYITRMFQDEYRQAVFRLSIAEETVSAKESLAQKLDYRMSLN